MAKPIGFVIAAAAAAASICAIEKPDRRNEQRGATSYAMSTDAPITSVNASVMRKSLPAIRNNEKDNVDTSHVTLFISMISGRSKLSTNASLHVEE